MACYNPLKSYITHKINPDTGKPIRRILPYVSDIEGLEYDLIPCTKCEGCRKDYGRHWADRLMLEKLYHKNGYFITLTYNNEHVPKAPDGTFNLCKKDIQDFIKRLRKHIGYSHYEGDKQISDVVYFASGEYGSQTLRPHYHFILFDIDIPDLCFKFRNKFGDPIYTSDIIQRIWSVYLGNDSNNRPIHDPIGHISVAELNWKTAAYVARYTSKKDMAEIEPYCKEHSLQIPFSVQSKGIGKQYFLDNPQVFFESKIYIDVGQSLEMQVPKYYTYLMNKIDPEIVKQVQAERHAINYQKELDRIAASKAETAIDFFINDIEKKKDSEYYFHRVTRCLTRDHDYENMFGTHNL